MKKSILLQLILLVFSVLNLYSQEITDTNLLANYISYNSFYSNLEFLSSDNLKGRDTGSEGYTLAAEYVADKFKENGLVPMGDNGTYFQKVPLIKRSMNIPSIKIQFENERGIINGIYGENISLLAHAKQDEIQEIQKLVFVGYGNIIPDENINDYKDIDVKDKTVIVILGGPKSVKSQLVYDPFFKVQNAVAQGAKGLVLVYPKRILQNLIFKKLHGFLTQPTMTLADTSLSKSLFDSDLKIAALAKKEFIKEIFSLNNLKLGKELKKIEKGNFASKELIGLIKCSYKIKVENIECKNVVALLKGADTSLMNEYVVLGSHLDHVGIGETIKGDSIYNGMWDNATGSAALISIAKAYNDATLKSKRSLLFVCYTGEEKGLLGSTYYVNNNLITDGKIVANVNIDMLGGIFETNDVIPMGYSHSNLSDAVNYSAKSLNFIIDDNKQEEDEYLFRSDQASFLKKGIPVLNIANGYSALNPKVNGKKEIDLWMKNYYHSPFDDLNQKYSKEAFHQALKLQFLTTYYITNIIEEIKWNEDSWIYKKYVLNEK